MHTYDQKPSEHVLQYDEFLKTDIRVGTIVQALEFPEARKPAYKLEIDFGPVIGKKWSSSRITDHYKPADLVGKQVLAVINFPARQVGPMMSQVLTLGFEQEDGTVIIPTVTHKLENGLRLY